MKEFIPRQGDVVAVSNNSENWRPAVFIEHRWDGGDIYYVQGYYKERYIEKFLYCEPLTKHFCVPRDV